MPLSLRLQKLEGLLPNTRPPAEIEPEDVEEVNLIDFDSTRGLNLGNHIESDEEEEPSGRGVGCAPS